MLAEYIWLYGDYLCTFEMIIRYVKEEEPEHPYHLLTNDIKNLRYSKYRNFKQIGKTYYLNLHNQIKLLPRKLSIPDDCIYYDQSFEETGMFSSEYIPYGKITGYCTVIYKHSTNYTLEDLKKRLINLHCICSQCGNYQVKLHNSVYYHDTVLCPLDNCPSNISIDVKYGTSIACDYIVCKCGYDDFRRLYVELL